MDMIELLPTDVQAVNKFQSVSIDSLHDGGQDASFMLGSFSRTDNFMWVTKGACIEVINRQNGSRIGSWNFGAVVKEPTTVIASVVEFREGLEPLLCIGLHTRGIGMVCVLNPVTSKLISAIELPSKVVSLEIINFSHNSEFTITYLEKLCGIVAVGMTGGLVYLLDLCLDLDVSSDETQPAKVNAVPVSTLHIELIRNSLDSSEHLAIILDSESISGGSYNYCRPDKKVIESFSSTTVCVTALKYIPHTGSLIVGFNFGCFQVWKIDKDALMLEFSSPFESDLAPATHIVYQEPENDPKEVVYVWIGRGPTFVDKREGDCSALSLYQFSYDSKKSVHGHGILYQGLQSVCHRFEYPLSTDPYNLHNSELAGSTLISCEVLCDAAYQRVWKRNEGIEDHGEDLSLCAFLWEATSDLDAKPVYLLGLFDLNRWYHAQMPSTLKRGHLSKGVCPFFAFCTLEDVVELAGLENIISAQISPESVTRYHSTNIPAPEQHFYPSALAFDLHCLLETGSVKIYFSGVQKQILSDIRKSNSATFIEPSESFNRSSMAEILPKFCETCVDVPNDLREALLSICIENAMTDVILNCINMWADGEYSKSGCTLRMVLNTAWTRVVKAKESIDKTCVPLFDCSMIGVDKRTIDLLHQQESELNRLCRVFQHLLNLSATTTEQGAHDLQVKLNVTSLLYDYIQVVTWLVVSGLLPETLEGETVSGKYNYPSESLPHAFSQQRQKLKSLNPDPSLSDLLMIDGLIDKIGGQVKDLWSKEGGNGLYPPLSLHAALAIYLIEDIPVRDKHCVFFYLLLDLISFSSDQDQKLIEDCTLFAQCFGLTPSLTRLVQGFWLLDHGDFNEAVHVLLDPIILEQDLSPWQHTRIIKALLYQCEAKLALMYGNIRLPNPTSAEDVKLNLTVLLASDNINQAFEYQRLKRDAGNCHDLIQHFFTGCLETKNLNHLVQLPLDDFEDKQLAEFLRNTSTCESMELLVMYYLQRGRYVQAIRLNEQMRSLRVIDTNPRVVERAIARDAIIQAHIKNLPEVQRDLVRADKLDDLPMRRERIEVMKPKPLSTKVNNHPRNKVTSRATLICAVMEKVKEVEIREDTVENQDRDEEELEVFVSLPATPKPRHLLNDSSIHQPTTMEKDLKSMMVKSTPSSFRGSPLSKISESAKKRMQRYQNAEAMALLATPPVKRLSTCRIKKPTATPQSILKVRNTVRNQSPVVKLKTPSNESIGRRNPFVSASASPHLLKPGTPKLLRFALSPARSSSQVSCDENESEKVARENQIIEVDEDITFNFGGVSVKKDDLKMDTDNSCPSTPSAVDEVPTPELSPEKIEGRPKFPIAATPREQTTQYLEDMESETDEKMAENPSSAREEPLTPTSAYEPARKMLDEVRVSFKETASASFLTPVRIVGESDLSEESVIADSEMTTELSPPKMHGKNLDALRSDLNQIVKASKSQTTKPMDIDAVEQQRSASPLLSTNSSKKPSPTKKSPVVKEPSEDSVMTPPTLSPETKISSGVDDVASDDEYDEPPVLEKEMKSDLKKLEMERKKEEILSHKSKSEPTFPRSDPSSPKSDTSPKVPTTPPSPRRSPRIAKKFSPVAQSVESRRERQSSPLSSDSFMMKVRTSSKGARDQTPEASADEPVQFIFSNPTPLDSGDIAAPKTPVPQPFIFSPPVTRSRRRRQEGRPSRAIQLRESVTSNISLTDSSIQDTEPSLLDVSNSTKSATKKTRRKIAAENSDSPINFVSPVTVAEGGRHDNEPKSENKMKLRSRFRVVRPERKSVRLMKK